jgi:repressor LexA
MLNNLKRLRENNQMSQQELADKLDISRQVYNNYELGKRQPPFEIIKQLAAILNTTTDYLLERTNIPTPLSNLKGYISLDDETVRIPVLGKVAAGKPIAAIEDIIDYVYISESMAKTGRFFALKIDGDSMEPKIKKGDTVIVRQQEDIESGQVAIVMVNGDDATCKAVTKQKNGIMLVSWNTTYDPVFFSNKQIEDLPITIIGKVVQLRSDF